MSRQEYASNSVLSVDGLTVTVGKPGASIELLDGVSFAVGRGETMCLVGESGSGKSVTALAIMDLLSDTTRASFKSMRFESEEVAGRSRRGLCGTRMAMIFQEPMTSLHPALTVGEQIIEGLLLHRRCTRLEARQRAIELLRAVRIAAPEARLNAYPHQLSGGMRQRVMIAMAIACEPALLIADEPTTALDVTVQAEILELLASLRDTNMGLLLITHDFGVVADIADRVAVMYAGSIVEIGSVRQVLDDPQHPYTLGLLSSVLTLDHRGGRLPTIDGVVPAPGAIPNACRFHPRCALADERCRQSKPPRRQFGDGHWAVCWKAPVEHNA